MLRTRNLAVALIVSAFMALLLLAIGAPATSGAISGGQSTMPSSMAPPIPSPVDCAQAPTDFQVLVLDLADGGVCRADSTEGTTPDRMPAFGRTCRCSCGYPCKTDADCGGAIGSCRGGISCC